MGPQETSHAPVERVSVDGVTIQSLFQDSGRFQIPRYQRPYRWSQVNWEDTLADLMEHHEIQSYRQSEYHIGEMKFEQQGGGVLGVDDGQQRLVTLSILLAAIGWVGRESARGLSCRHLTCVRVSTSEGDLEVARVEDQDPALNPVLARILTETDPDELGSAPVEQAYRFFIEHLRERFCPDGTLDDLALAEFRNTVLSRTIITKTVFSAGMGHQSFARANSRGRALTTGDLVKSELLSIAARGEDAEKVWTDWREAITLLGNEKALSSWVLCDISESEAPVRDNQLRALIAKEAKAEKLKGGVHRLTKRLLDYARASHNLEHGRSPDGKRVVPSVANLRKVPALRSSKQFFQLLLAGRHLPTGDFDKLARAVEDSVVVATVVSAFPPDVERLVARLAFALRKAASIGDENGAEVTEALAAFRNQHRQAFADRLVYATEGELKSQTLITVVRYCDAHARAVLNAKSDAQGRGEIDLENTREHVLPQHLTDETLEEYGDEVAAIRDRFRIGNLCLLEMVPNATISNEPFTKKRPAYARAPYRVTSSIVTPPSPSGREGSLGEYLPHFDQWTPAAVQARSEALHRLACETFAIECVQAHPVDGTTQESVQVPQADNPEVLVKVLEALRFVATTTEAAAAVGFDDRQGSYYAKAAETLGLAQEDDGTWSLTGEGEAVVGAADPCEALRGVLREHSLVSTWVDMTEDQRSAFLRGAGLSDATAKRRAATLNRWVAYAGLAGDDSAAP
jgi:hypothetical protein